MSAESFDIVYDEEIVEHLTAIESKYHSMIRDTVEQQLTHQPDVETRNRKPLRRPSPFGATWEIRFGPDNRFRVFYKIDGGRREVQVVTIGVKERARLWVGGKEVTS